MLSTATHLEATVIQMLIKSNSYKAVFWFNSFIFKVLSNDLGQNWKLYRKGTSIDKPVIINANLSYTKIEENLKKPIWWTFKIKV